MTTPTVPIDALADRLLVLRDAVAGLRFDLSGRETFRLRALRDRVAGDIAGQAQRVRDLDAPLLVVLGGVTGAGKSTCVNSLVGRKVVKTGVIRPTTYAPTLVTHPSDADAFAGGRILPDLPRASGPVDIPVGGDADAGVLRLVASDALPAGLALLDAPDVDSVESANRDLADQLLDAADLWLWFTTVGKYADEESMRYLRRARERNTSLAVVLTQVEPRDVREVVEDFRGKLAAEGLGATDIVVVPYDTVTDGQLPPAAVAPLRHELEALADPEARRALRRRTLDGAVRALPAEVAPLLEATDDERRAARRLGDEAERTYRDIRAEFTDALEQGLPLREEVLARWDRFVGSGAMLRLAERAGQQARAWVRETLAGSGGTAPERRLEREVRVEVGETVRDLAVQLSELAAAETADGWERMDAGQGLLAQHPDLAAAGPRLHERAGEMVREWEQAVAELVETRGVERRSAARWASGGINALATGGIVVAFAQTGGITGAEAGIAAAAGAANQAVLAKLLGEHNLRWLLGRAREDLIDRYTDLLREERERYDAVVARAAPDEQEEAAVDAALAAVAEVSGR